MKVKEGYTCLDFAYDLVLFRDTRQNITQTLIGLINAGKRIGLSVNQLKEKGFCQGRRKTKRT